MSTWEMVLLEPAKGVLTQISHVLVNALLVIIILLIGWVLSKLLKAVVTKTLRGVKLDDLSDKIELDALMAKGGIKYSLSELLGVIAYWLGMLVTFVVAINSVGLTVAADLLNKVVLYVPNIVAAVFIMVLGMFLATILKNVVQTAAVNAGLSQVNLLSQVVSGIVIAFTVVTALKQLRIDTRLIELSMTVLLGSIGLAVALAFGLGCKELAGKTVADIVEKIKSKK